MAYVGSRSEFITRLHQSFRNYQGVAELIYMPGLSQTMIYLRLYNVQRTVQYMEFLEDVQAVKVMLFVNGLFIEELDEIGPGHDRFKQQLHVN
jgi:hypothetical protein